MSDSDLELAFEPFEWLCARFALLESSRTSSWGPKRGYDRPGAGLAKPNFESLTFRECEKTSKCSVFCSAYFRCGAKTLGDSIDDFALISEAKLWFACSKA